MVILLIGVCVWGVLGHLDTTLSVAAVAENGNTTLYVKEMDIGCVKEWVYGVSVNGTLPNGVHSAEIVIESVSPMSFIAHTKYTEGLSETTGAAASPPE